MTFLANTRVAVLRGTPDKSPLGDEYDDNSAEAEVPGLADLPASLIERTRSVWDSASGTPRTIRVVKCRIPVAGYDEDGERVNVQLEDGDRIRDNRTGKVYALEATTAVPRSLAGMSSLTLDLRDTSIPV